MQITNEAKDIIFRHIPTNKLVRFRAFITDYADAYESNWNSEEVYGRMDPIMTFKNTGRKITLGWDVVAGSATEAYQNMQNISKLLRFQYPVYEGGQTLAAAPLLRLKFVNWALNGTNPRRGLVGTLAGVTFKPILEEGYFDGPDRGMAQNFPDLVTPLGMEGSGFKDNLLLPKAVSLNCTFTVLHTHLMGWDVGKDDTAEGSKKAPFGGKMGGQAVNFPYDIDEGLRRTISVTPTASPGTDGGPAQPVAQARQENVLSADANQTLDLLATSYESSS